MNSESVQHEGALLVVESAADVGAAAASIVFSRITQARQENRQCVIGCPGGRSAVTTYAALADLIRQNQTPIDHVVIAMMDDYVIRQSEESPTLVNADADAHYSCARFAHHHIANPLNEAAPTGHGIDPANIWVPTAGDPEAYELALRTAGVDVFILAVGASDGHVAFNSAPSLLESGTRMVELSVPTRLDNTQTFPDFDSLEDVPRYGVTVGPATIRDVSARVVLVVHGQHKAESLKRIMATRQYQSDWPATVVWECKHPMIIADRRAAELLGGEARNTSSSARDPIG